MSGQDSHTFLCKNIKKTITNAGLKEPSFSDNSKGTFHFCTKILKPPGSEDEILDDSRKIGKPMEILFGKQFRLPVWETCLKSMRVGEVAKFAVDKKLVEGYSLVSNSYKKFAGVIENVEPQRGCCGMNALKSTLDPKSCDSLLTEQKDLEFTFELISVEDPGEYEREAWSMAPEEKLGSIPKLREEGNKLYQAKSYQSAAEKYSEALGRLEQLVLREKPSSEEWLELEKLKIPLLLNFSQCKLIEKDYYAVIEHTSTVLKSDPSNVKALYRRGKAHIGAWNPQEAQEDLERVVELDPMLKGAVNKELRDLKELQKEKDKIDKDMLKGKMFNI